MASIKDIVKRYKKDRTHLLDILRDVQKEIGPLSDETITEIADTLKMSRVEVEGPATFYHFFSSKNRGKFTVYLNKSVTSEMFGCAEVAKAFEEAVGCKFGTTCADGRIGLYYTSCIGMCDQEPAAIINDVIFTSLTADKVHSIVGGLKDGKTPEELVTEFGDGNNSLPEIKAMVQNNIKKQGAVFFGDDYTPGAGLKKALSIPSEDVIEEMKGSNLRGRGGAGFPTGMKWGFCRASEAPARYVMCNVDEGEPGTFKDRVLLTEKAEQIFEGMTIAGFAIEATEGIMYLRGEYQYLKNHLEGILEKMRKNNLLGKKILGTKFNFDITIKMGAGAYICGEESALIESAEGKRGQPRNRPPFPVQVGYKNLPTVVNNPETYSCTVKIMEKGADWFKNLGTENSSGVKLLSISGDVAEQGVYEVEWGLTVKEMLEMAGAKDTQAVLIGGPSGTFVSPAQFDRKICYSDLGTGGAIIVFDNSRDLFQIVHNYMEFFVEESCGFCVPCRAGNVLLTKTLEKIMVGNGTMQDLENIKEWGQFVKTASRCGLGQTSPNPMMTTLENFKELYESKVRKDTDYQTQFDMSFAVADSCKAAGRQPNLKGHE